RCGGQATSGRSRTRRRLASEQPDPRGNRPCTTRVVVRPPHSFAACQRRPSWEPGAAAAAFPERTMKKLIDMHFCPIPALRPPPPSPALPGGEEPDKDLADTTGEGGPLNPITAPREKAFPPGPRRWVIISGHRRWRAAKAAGLDEVLVVEVPERKKPFYL